MALKQSKKISELEALSSASLNTTILGVDNGTTYKIELDVLADSVKDRINTIDSIRLNNLESTTGSYLTSLNGTITSSSQLSASFDARYITIGSIPQTNWNSITDKPSGIISGSSQIFGGSGVISSSIGISELNTYTSSQDVLNIAFTNGINNRLNTSSFNLYTASQSTSSIVSRLNSIETMSSSWVNDTETGSFLTSLNGAISASSQITAFGFISSSSSTDITYLNTFTSSQSILNTAFTNGISARLQTSSFNAFSTSVDSRLDTLESLNVTKTSGFVNAGTFLTLDNLKVTLTTGGNRGLSVGAVSTNFTANISGWYGYTGGGSGASGYNVAYTTTASTSTFNWGFGTEGDGSNYIINDKTNNRVYRVTMMVGASFNNNFISIERLY
jgi:hypothetical protein